MEIDVRVQDLPARKDFPDPLVMFDGRRVETPDQWFRERKPELQELFQHYMYGYFPPPPGNETAKVRRIDREFLKGKATLKELTISFGPPGCPGIDVILIVPNRRRKPAPVFVGLNFHGNHTMVDDERVAPPVSPGGEGKRGADTGRWAVDMIVGRGYALASAYCGDIDPDRNDFTDGVHPFYMKEGQKERGPHDWGTIAAWAWGIHRIVDYLVTDSDMDRTRIVVTGHSRLGKTALLAAAFDERIALAIPNMAGCGGTAPSRGTVGESVKQINSAFPHWFCGKFKEFNDKAEFLPFDQHCLTAIVAPRPVLFNNAVEDTWANPLGQFEVLKAAEPVYRLLKAGKLAARRMPPVGKLVSIELGYHIRPGKHDVISGDWEIYLEFADRHLKRGGRKPLSRAP